MKPCNQCDIYGKGSLLGSLQESDLEKMNHNRRRFPMRKNQILFTTGQPLNGWYCVKKGKIRIYRVSSGGKEQTYRIAGPGDWIGHREMIEESDSHFNAVSLQESEICFIPRSVWPSLLNNRSFTLALLGNLSHQLNRAEEMIFAMGTKKLHARLAELLLLLADEDETRTISLTRELMSTMVGSTTETIVRALSDFKDRKWVEVEKNRITLLDRAALKEMAQVDQL